ncbi:MAG: lipid-A-disaccharide synthase [Candidatus Cloacimonetes bacterium]|nr:lipid-A-disaccharide synthase [Candidatus Cloacimonadota bacterium]
MKKIFWLVGDKSGDLHASKVMQQLNQDISPIQHIGIGGPLMQNQGLELLFPYEKFLIMGFAEVVKHLPFILKVEYSLKKFLAQNRPDLVVLVDYPGLNLRIARMSFKLRLKVFYFICPQFWAWKHFRVLKLKKYCDYVACILPFEKKMLDNYLIPSSYVGHPVKEEIVFQLDKNGFAEKYQLAIKQKWIGFFPGSRANEVQRLLPIYLEVIKKLKNIKPNYQFLISKSNSLPKGMFDDLLLKNQLKDMKIIDENNYEMIKYSDFLIVKSGTSTIETSCIGTPFVIVYKANCLSYILAKRIIKVKYIGMPNIIFDKLIVPELIQNDVNRDKIIETILFYLDNEDEYQKMSSHFKDLHDILGTLSASKTTADLINNLIHGIAI